MIGTTTNVGNTVGDMGTYLDPTLVGSNVLVQLMDGGDEHFCMLSMKGKIKCWGSNSSGFHFYYILFVISYLFLKIRSTGRLGYGDILDRGDESNQMNDYLPFVNVGGDASDLICSAESSCAVLLNGDYKCWGRNHVGFTYYGNFLKIYPHIVWFLFFRPIGLWRYF